MKYRVFWKFKNDSKFGFFFGFGLGFGSRSQNYLGFDINFYKFLFFGLHFVVLGWV